MSRRRAPPPLRDRTRRGSVTPVSPLFFYSLGSCPQGHKRNCVRARRCLLKGCERWFHPTRPQARYCSRACRQAARRWRRWRASQRWRQSEAGKSRRREQSRRYRERVRQRPTPGATPEPKGVPSACEGQRAEKKGLFFPSHVCDRPGCYEVFAVTRRSPLQRFCSSACRQALRRVRQREWRWRQRVRRRRGELLFTLPPPES